ncbi:MAG: FGGY-family carbohydrate kinase, partial [Spirochaetia bacterium]|nr:FGGY-family carbohydrate kinase [Spirochaetia bacterium]
MRNRMAKVKKRTDECVIAIDAGTQSMRAAAFDMRGEVIDIVKTPMVPYISNKPGWAEQDPEYYWKNLCVTCKKLMREISFHKESIKGVSLTTQRMTFVNVDKDGKPIRPAIVWLDQRKAKPGKWPSAPIDIILRMLGIRESVLYGICDSEANWLMQNQPEIWDKTYKFLLLSGFLTMRLTGEFRDSVGSTVGYLPLDYKRQKWAPKYDMKWKMFPIDHSKLNDLVKPSEPLGYITAQGARETGLPQGLPLIAAAADKACEVLGSGCLSPETACVSYGTTATIDATCPKYVEVVPFFPAYPGAVPETYNTEIMIVRGFWMSVWFREQFASAEAGLAKKRGIAPEALFDEFAAKIPAGSMGLTLQPFWSPGIVRIPGPEAKGSIIGFGDVHTKWHIYRAVLEGLAYALKEGTIRTEKKTGVKITSLKISGGGSQSALVSQITADIFNLPAERPHTFEAAALGAAI